MFDQIFYRLLWCFSSDITPLLPKPNNDSNQKIYCSTKNCSRWIHCKLKQLRDLAIMYHRFLHDVKMLWHSVVACFGTIMGQPTHELSMLLIFLSFDSFSKFCHCATSIVIFQCFHFTCSFLHNYISKFRLCSGKVLLLLIFK